MVMELEARAVKGRNFSDRARMLIFKPNSDDDARYLGLVAAAFADGGKLVVQDKDGKVQATYHFSGLGGQCG